MNCFEIADLIQQQLEKARADLRKSLELSSEINLTLARFSSKMSNKEYQKKNYRNNIILV